MKLFDYNSPISKFLERVVDLVIINVLWSICCLPVVTAGAATVAMYSCIHRLDTKTGHVVANYWAAFKENFATATLFWIGMLIIGGALVLNLYLLYSWDFQGKTILFIFIVLIIGVYLMVMAWMYPLLAYYKTTLRKAFGNAVALAGTHLFQTLEMVLFNIIPLALFLFKTSWF
ncbi:MAG: YesL family protein, partial [Oscillospiraceae bacterium]|nr:YesL family protein [Oscillospiraceae bacterium]